MNGDLKKLIPILIVLTFALAGSYLAFQQYNPRVLTGKGEVQGAQISEEVDLPMPISSEKIYSSRTFNSTQTTFQTKKTPEEVMSFYQNIFTEKKWVPESVRQDANIFVTTYSDQDSMATITATRQQDDELTIVSFKVWRR